MEWIGSNPDLWEDSDDDEQLEHSSPRDSKQPGPKRVADKPSTSRRLESMAENEDYMGDLSAFVGSSEAEKVWSQAHARSSGTNKRGSEWKKLPWQERRKLKQQETNRKEAEARDAGLAAPMSSSSIGFKLLQKMGFSPDRQSDARTMPSSMSTQDPDVAKATRSWAEPIDIRVKADKKGLGLAEEEREEEARKERQASEEHAKLVRRQEAISHEFKETKRGRWDKWKMRRNFQKARAALLHLEGSDSWLVGRVVARFPEAAAELGIADESSGGNWPDVPHSDGKRAQSRESRMAGSAAAGGSGSALWRAGEESEAVPRASGGAGARRKGGEGRGNPRETTRVGHVRKKRRVEDCDADDVEDEEWEEVEAGRVAGEGREDEREGGGKGKRQLEDFVTEEVG